MELRVLRYVIALAEEEHFGRAALRVHVAQSALSQQVKQLETELGVRLFDRSTRRVSITEAGRRFVEHARGIVDAAAHAADDMRATADGRTGSVSIGFVGTATYDVLPRVARQVRLELPGVELSLRGELLSPSLIDGVRGGTFDLGLVRATSGDAGLTFVHLRTERLVAVVPTSHELSALPLLDLSALAGEPFVVHPRGSAMHHQVMVACAASGFTPDKLVEVGETATLAVSVAAGLGVALVPEPVRSLRLDGVTYVDLRDGPVVDLALVSRRSGRSPAVERVAAIVRQCVVVAVADGLPPDERHG